jgi:hypothetical protein
MFNMQGRNVGVSSREGIFTENVKSAAPQGTGDAEPPGRLGNPKKHNQPQRRLLFMFHSQLFLKPSFAGILIEYGYGWRSERIDILVL